MTFSPSTPEVEIHTGGCVDVMMSKPQASIDAIVTDPPYGLEFMTDWDCLASKTAHTMGAGRTSKPGIGKRAIEWPSNRGWNDKRCRICGHLTHGGSPCVCPESDFAAADDRWRQMQAWHEIWAKAALRVLKPGAHAVVFGGSRTFHRLACAMEDAGFELRDVLCWLYGSGMPKSHHLLKPAWEPILLCRRPLCGTMARNVEQFGVGPLNIDGCRVTRAHQPRGWPANVLLDEDSAALLDASVDRPTGQQAALTGNEPSDRMSGPVYGKGARRYACEPHDTPGGPARFFYCAKASKSEREAGCESLPQRDGRGNYHPTVKPVALMRWLVRLVSPLKGLVLDPFAGSGTTAIACLAEDRRCIAIEREPEYVAIARARVTAATRTQP